MEKGSLEYMTLFLPVIIFGAWAVLSVYFDLISSDREKNVMDCILCSGITKRQIFLSKLITAICVSMMLSLLYLLPITVVLISMGRSILYAEILFRYLFPLWGFIMMFASWALLLSIIARSSKTALIWCLAGGLILMPRFFMIIVDGLGGVFKWTQTMKNYISMLAPGIMLQALADNSDRIKLLIAIVYFTLGNGILFAAAYFTFVRQDEYNYGE